MAARRLQSDRFFTDDYTPETYTPEGLEWIDATTMGDVIRRTLPAAARRPENAFLTLGLSSISLELARTRSARPAGRGRAGSRCGSSSAIRRSERR